MNIDHTGTSTSINAKLAESFDLAPLREYALARQRFLASFGCDDSCRDPLTEFSERIVAKLLNATPARSRTERGYDLIKPDGRLVQVRSLSNPTAAWERNEHHVKFTGAEDDYALVVFERLLVRGVVVFPKETLGEVCQLLGKRHGQTHCTLQFTRKNFAQILDKRSSFAQLGVLIFAD